MKRATTMATDPDLQPLARGGVYRFLSLLFADPVDSRAPVLRDQLPLLLAGLELLGDDHARAVAEEVAAALDGLDAPALRDSYRRCFGHAISKECPPYESEYGVAHVFQKSQCLADIAGFYRAFGLDLAADFHDRADHISAELDFMQWLCLKTAHAAGAPERLQICENAQRGFLQDHLGRWAASFAARTQCTGSGSFHALGATLLAVFVQAEMRDFELPPPPVVGLAEGSESQGNAETGCAGCAVSTAPLEL